MSEEKTTVKNGMVVITVQRNVQVPSLPNFITVHEPGGERKLSVGDLTDEQLRRVGEEWTAALIKHAQQKRQSKEAALHR